MVLLNVRSASVCHGSDQDCLRILIPLHVRPEPTIADVTYGHGRFWKNLQWQPQERVDCRELPNLTYQGDFRKLPEAWTDRFDLVVFDPPHLAEAGKTSKYNDRFGSRMAELEHVPDITFLYGPFLREARRVLRPGGVVLAKLTDTVHRGKMHFQVTDFIVAARGVSGLTPCDYLVKDNPSASRLTGHNWATVHHTRRAHAFWLVVRKGRC